MTVTFFEFVTSLLIINTYVLCAERRLWGIADDSKYSYFDDRRRQEMLEATRQMFYFGYDSYMTHAFPMDELDPIHCTGRGPDYDDPYAALIASVIVWHHLGFFLVFVDPLLVICCASLEVSAPQVEKF